MKKSEYFIEPALLAELRNKRDSLINRVSDETGLHSALLEASHLEASYHSKITEPDHAVTSRRIGRRRDFRNTRYQLEEARTYAKANFNGEVTQPLVLGIGKILQPSISGYRTNSVFISGYGHSGVNPAKIQEQMNSLINLSNDPSWDPVERAILFQLHFLRIHPFEDGNGRTGRFVQNTILAHNKYAPAALAPGERSFYNDLINRAQVEFREREADGELRAPELMAVPPKVGGFESQFIHYIATKVNVGMDQLIGDYDRLPHYQIQLFGFSDPGQVMRVKKLLSAHFKVDGEPFHVSVTNRKRGMIEIRADTNDKVLTGLLEKRSRLPYKIFRYD